MNMTFDEIVSQLTRDLAINETNKSVGSKQGGNVKQFLAFISLGVAEDKAAAQPFVLDNRSLTANFSSLKPLTLVSLRTALSSVLTDEVCARLVKDDMLALVSGKIAASDVKSAITDMEKDMVRSWGICQELNNNLDNEKTVTLLEDLNKCFVANVQFSIIRVVGLEKIIANSIDDKGADLSIFKVSMPGEEELALT